MNASDLVELLRDLIEQDARDEIARVRSYDEIGMMTRDAGLLIRSVNDDEFQVTVLRTRRGGDG